MIMASVKLSTYECAVNALNDLSPKHDKIMSAALDELRSQRDENKRLLQRAQSVIHQILEQYPHVNCVWTQQGTYFAFTS